MATILVVDDNTGNRKYIAALMDCLGHKSIEAANGESALAITQRMRPDLIILDLLMPVMNGYEFMRKLRADPDVAGTRTLFYTGLCRDAEVTYRAIEFGVMAVLPKPSRAYQIMRAVREALGDESRKAPAWEPVFAMR